MGFQRRASDADLVARVRAGDAASYNELHERHIENAQRVARLVAPNPEQAAGLAEEAFAAVLAHLREGRAPGGEFAPYLRTMVRRLAADRYRTGTATGGELTGTLDDPGDLRTTHPMVRQAYETLPPRWQQVLWRSDVQGETPAGLAATFETTPDAAAALAHRAREGLRRAYLGLHVACAGAEDCKAIGPRVSALARGVLDADDRHSVEEHLAGCAACRDRYEEMLLLASDLPGVLTGALIGIPAPSRAAATKTLAVPVPAPSAAGAAGAPGAAGAANAPPAPGRRAPRRRVSTGSGVMVGTLVAATVAVVAFALVVANSGGPASQTAGPPPAAGESPSDEPARVSVETATPSPEMPAAASQGTPEPDQESSRDLGSDPSQESEADGETTPEPEAAGSSPADTAAPAEQGAAQAEEEQALEQEPEPRQDTPAATAAGSRSPESGSSDAAALEAQAQGDDEPGWWCQAVPWWPDCSDASEGERRDESAGSGGGPPEEVPPGISRNALCEWLPDLPPCSAGERDRQRGGPPR